MPYQHNNQAIPNRFNIPFTNTAELASPSYFQDSTSNLGFLEEMNGQHIPIQYQDHPTLRNLLQMNVLQDPPRDILPFNNYGPDIIPSSHAITSPSILQANNQVTDNDSVTMQTLPSNTTPLQVIVTSPMTGNEGQMALHTAGPPALMTLETNVDGRNSGDKQAILDDKSDADADTKSQVQNARLLQLNSQALEINEELVKILSSEQAKDTEKEKSKKQKLEDEDKTIVQNSEEKKINIEKRRSMQKLKKNFSPRVNRLMASAKKCKKMKKKVTSTKMKSDEDKQVKSQLVEEMQGSSENEKQEIPISYENQKIMSTIDSMTLRQLLNTHIDNILGEADNAGKCSQSANNDKVIVHEVNSVQKEDVPSESTKEVEVQSSKQVIEKKEGEAVSGQLRIDYSRYNEGINTPGVRVPGVKTTLLHPSFLDALSHAYDRDPELFKQFAHTIMRDHTGKPINTEDILIFDNRKDGPVSIDVESVDVTGQVLKQPPPDEDKDDAKMDSTDQDKSTIKSAGTFFPPKRFTPPKFDYNTMTKREDLNHHTNGFLEKMSDFVASHKVPPHKTCQAVAPIAQTPKPTDEDTNEQDNEYIEVTLVPEEEVDTMDITYGTFIYSPQVFDTHL